MSVYLDQYRGAVGASNSCLHCKIVLAIFLVES